MRPPLSVVLFSFILGVSPAHAEQRSLSDLFKDMQRDAGKLFERVAPGIARHQTTEER